MYVNMALIYIGCVRLDAIATMYHFRDSPRCKGVAVHARAHARTYSLEYRT